jgi:hypothetical protein
MAPQMISKKIIHELERQRDRQKEERGTEEGRGKRERWISKRL